MTNIAGRIESRGFGAAGFRVTKRDLQKLTHDVSFPYTVEYRTNEKSEFKTHSRIQTIADECMFLDFATRKAQYRVAAGVSQ